MKHEIESYFEPDIVWLGEINRRVLRLERATSVFPPPGTYLHCALWNGRESRAGVALTLCICGTELHSRAEDASPVQATRCAFDDLERALSFYMEQQRQEGFWSRTSLNLAPNASTTAEPPDREEAIRLIDRHLVSLFNFVRREIAYRQAVGDLVAGDLTAEDVVDEVALGAIEHFDARPQELGFSRWLLQLALDVIERRVREINEECETHVHVEEDMPETPPAEEATQVGDEIFEFYQPDEDIRLEDLIADERVPTPEEALAQREMQQYINRTLARLPRRWREAFVLYSVEGLTLEEVGRVVQRPVEDVRRWIDLTRAFLRQCLVEAGAVPADREAMREEVNVR
jgi:RNA polymerase sigma factor (sigma-70 family)